MAGGSLEVLAEIRNPDGQPHRGTLIVNVDGDPETTLPISAGEQYEHYRVTLPAIDKPLAYRLEIGDSQTKIYRVTVREKPIVTQTRVTYHYPTYLQRSDETAVQKEANIEAPQYTVAELQIQASVPIARGYVELDQQPKRLDGRVGDDGRSLRNRPIADAAKWNPNDPPGKRCGPQRSGAAGQSDSRFSRSAADRRVAQATAREHGFARRRRRGYPASDGRSLARPPVVGDEDPEPRVRAGQTGGRPGRGRPSAAQRCIDRHTAEMDRSRQQCHDGYASLSS